VIFQSRFTQLLSVCAATFVLAGCGGGDASVPTPIAAGVPAGVPASGSSTTFTGAVVKGPVASAQVCGYSVSANARGALVGACTTSDASGNYTLTLPVASGELWLEASGGTYVDEATAASTSLPVGSSLRSLVTANGSAVTAMVTPLTTLALNSAAVAAGSGGKLDATLFNTAAAQVLGSFKLPPDLNIATTVPSFGSGINSYGAALTAISKMVANGQTLAALLATVNPQTLATAYAAAALAPSGPTPTPPTPPITPAPPPGDGGTLGAITAVGRVTGSTTETFEPRAITGNAPRAAFATSILGGSTSYSFYNQIRTPDATGSTTGAGTQVITYSVLNGVASITFVEIVFTRGFSLSIQRFCKAPCSGVTLVPTSTGQGVTLSFNNASFELSPFGSTVSNPPTEPTVMNGSLTGEMPGGYVFESQLPKATAGTLTLDNVATPILHARVSTTVFNRADGQLFPSVDLFTARGTFNVSRIQSTEAVTNARFQFPNPSGELFFLRVADSALSSTTTGYAINMTNAVLTSGSGSSAKKLEVTAQITTGKSGGTVNIGGDGAFSPQSDTLQGDNQSLIYDFRGISTSQSTSFSTVRVQIKEGAVILFSATSPNGKSYSCYPERDLFAAKCEGTITVSADKRTLTFNNFKAGLGLSPNATVSFEGSLTAAGL
jgi:hypothetical protein